MLSPHPFIITSRRLCADLERGVQGGGGVRPPSRNLWSTKTEQIVP
jgi:hypothetical protein